MRASDFNSILIRRYTCARAKFISIVVALARDELLSAREEGESSREDHDRRRSVRPRD